MTLFQTLSLVIVIVSFGLSRTQSVTYYLNGPNIKVPRINSSLRSEKNQRFRKIAWKYKLTILTLKGSLETVFFWQKVRKKIFAVKLGYNNHGYNENRL